MPNSPYLLQKSYFTSHQSQQIFLQIFLFVHIELGSCVPITTILNSKSLWYIFKGNNKYLYCVECQEISEGQPNFTILGRKNRIHDWYYFLDLATYVFEN